MSETEGFIAADIIEDIEEAIKYKLKSEDDYSPPEMANAIMRIPQNVDAKLKEKEIEQNGRYDAIDDYADGYSRVDVNVKKEESGGKILPVLINLNASENGSYDASDEGADGYALVNVNVPGGGSSLTEETILENGVFDPPAGFDGFSRVNVHVYSDEVNIGEKETPITENGVYESMLTDNKDGYSKVNVQIPLENSKSVTENGEVLPSPGFTAIKKVNVNIPLQDSKTVTKNGNVFPDSGYEALKRVIVNVPTSGGGGGVVGEKDITQNGTYNAIDDNLDGYDVVNVNVPKDPPNLETRSETTTSQTTYTPSPGYDGIGSITINPEPPLEEKAVTLESSSSTPITPSSGKYGMSKVTVTPKLEEKSVTLTSPSQTIVTTSPGNAGMSKITINPSFPLEERSVTLESSSSTTITPTSGKYGMNKVTVTPKMETKSITQNGTYSPTTGNVGFSSVNVQVPGGGNATPGIFTSNGTYTPPSEFIGYSPVTVQVPCATTPGTFTSNGTYSPPDGNIGFSSVSVQVPGPNLGSQTFTTNGEYFASSYGYDGFSSVNVQVPTGATIDWNNVVYYNDGTKNVVIEPDRRSYLGGYPVGRMVPYGVSKVYVGRNIIDGQNMFYQDTTFNAQVEVIGEIIDYSSMFSECKQYNSPTINITNAYSLSYMFNNCINFSKDVNIFFTHSSYASINAALMFSNCTNFKNFVNIDMNRARITNCYGMFMNCTNLNKNINIPPSVLNASAMFSGCKNFDNHFIFNGSAQYKINNAYGMFSDIDKAFTINNYQTLNLYSEMYSVMFRNCYNMDCNMPSFKVMNRFTSFDYMFDNCKKFNKIVNMYLNTGTTGRSQASPMSILAMNMFEHCNMFNSDIHIYLPNYIIFNGQGMFSNCPNMASTVYLHGSSYFQEKGSYLFMDLLSYRNNTHAGKRLTVRCATTNIYNVILNSHTGGSWVATTGGVYNTRYNVYVYNSF